MVFQYNAKNVSLTSTTTPGLSGHGSNGRDLERGLTSKCNLLSYPEHSFRKRWGSGLCHQHILNATDKVNDMIESFIFVVY